MITDGCPTIAPSAIVDPRENLSERPSASELANMAGVREPEGRLATQNGARVALTVSRGKG